MFSGIVEALGRVRSVEDQDRGRRFTIEVREFAGELALGDSVAVDGACLTVVARDEETFAVDVISTTLAKTVAGAYEPGHLVNLERALRLGDRLDGHLVQGHVDAVGRLERSVPDGEAWLMDFSVPAEVMDATVPQGSITLNGVSLTVSELLGDTGVRIGVIPHTFRHTNLGSLAPGSPVNVEGDVIGKYVGRILERRAGGDG